MNFDKITSFAISVVVMAAIAGNLDRLNHWVQVATAKVLWESRASAWAQHEGNQVVHIFGNSLVHIDGNATL